jgi:hypothetical protein
MTIVDELAICGAGYPRRTQYSFTSRGGHLRSKFEPFPSFNVSQHLGMHLAIYGRTRRFTVRHDLSFSPIA